MMIIPIHMLNPLNIGSHFTYRLFLDKLVYTIPFILHSFPVGLHIILTLFRRWQYIPYLFPYISYMADFMVPIQVMTFSNFLKYNLQRSASFCPYILWFSYANFFAVKTVLNNRCFRMYLLDKYLMWYISFFQYLIVLKILIPQLVRYFMMHLEDCSSYSKHVYTIV